MTVNELRALLGTGLVRCQLRYTGDNPDFAELPARIRDELGEVGIFIAAGMTLVLCPLALTSAASCEPTSAGPMDDLEFAQVLDGPLGHPLIPFRLMRLEAALYDVIRSAGEPAAVALRRHAQAREDLDRLKSGD